MAASTARRWLTTSLKATVTISLICLVLRGVDLAEAMRHLRGLSFVGVALVLLLLVSQGFIGAWRWTFTTRVFGSPLQFSMALRLFFEGIFFNQALPSTVGGDAVRMYRCTRVGMPVGAAVNGVLLDRVGGVSGLLALVAISQPLAWQRIPDLGPRLAFVAVLVSGAGAIAMLLAMASLPERWRRWRLISGIADLSAGARRMYRDPVVVVPVLGLSLVVHVITVFAVYILARDLGLPVTFWDCLVLIPLVFLAATIPISIAGWGVREGAMITALGLLGVSTSGAVTLSVLSGLGLIVIGLIGGGVWLARGDHRVISADEIERTTDPDVRSV
jgi:uncharacterized membrane protein YbhN (UPF0104 family)